MACLVFLSVAIYPMLTCLTQAQADSYNAQERMIVMGLIQDQFETQRTIANGSALTTGTTVSTQNPAGVYTSVSMTTVIALVTGYTDLFSVQVTASWGNATLPNRNGTITLTTYMRAPHV